MCKWKKPDFGWTKLNTDGSITPKRSGFGGLLRDHMGDPICAFASNARGDDIFLVELWAIESGLRLALDMGTNVIWVESDSLSAVKSINNDQPFSQKAASCLKNIWELLRKFEKHKVSHAWRETNRAADYLAKMVLFEKDYMVLLPHDFPSGLHKIIKDDSEEKIYCRGSNEVLWWKPKL
jgi:ribonuclease HI